LEESWVYIVAYINPYETMPRKTVALSLDDRTYRQYRNYCKRNSLVLSRTVESFMKEELRNSSTVNTEENRTDSKRRRR